MISSVTTEQTPSQSIKLFLCGDVMTGRGIDQILPHPGKPQLYEPYVNDAREYINLAEQTNGSIPRKAGYTYIWGDALDILNQEAPDKRIINLETSITRSSDYLRNKAIHYRMHPDNIQCLTQAGIDCCILANNHVLDWGGQGLQETLRSLKHIHIHTAGAGDNLQQAQTPAILPLKNTQRVIVLAYGLASSGVTADQSATLDSAGINHLPDLSADSVQAIQNTVRNFKQSGDIVVVSLHWGDNWGYRIEAEQQKFAHAIIDTAAVDIVYGHSSHHPLGIEIYKRKLILYGCGDLINDYEGISGHEQYRGDLSLMYFARIDPANGNLVSLNIRPMKIRRFCLHRASRLDSEWLCNRLNRESKQFNTRITLTTDNQMNVLSQDN